ncbi:MAG: tetratricopeptide repeat protein [Myxococcales bacterium]|nr:tetratricopeptide repeat protein [Myxococcales bacterium]
MTPTPRRARRPSCARSRARRCSHGAWPASTRADARLATLTRGLASAGDAPGARALGHAAALKPTARCLEREQLLDQSEDEADAVTRARVTALRDELAELRALTYGGDQRELATRAADTLARAEALGHAPVVAEAALLLGRMQVKLSAFAEATETLERAHFTARESGHREVAVDAAAELIYATGFGLAKGELARVWAKNADAELSRLGPGGPEERTLLTVRGNTWAGLGELDEARADLQRALELTRARFGERDPRTGAALNNLGRAYAMSGELDRAGELFAASHAAWRASVGDEHPEAALAIGNLASVYDLQGRRDEARALYERQLAILLETRGEHHAHTASTLHNLATLHVSDGARELAEGYLQRALAAEERIFGPAHPELAETLNSLADNARARGDFAAARAHAERSLALLAEAETASKRRETATAHMFRGISIWRMGHPEDALEDLARAVALYAEDDPGSRLLHRARRERGGALWDAGQRADGRAETLRAREGFAALGPEHQEQLDEIDGWLAARPDE